MKSVSHKYRVVPYQSFFYVGPPKESIFFDNHQAAAQNHFLLLIATLNLVSPSTSGSGFCPQ